MRLFFHPLAFLLLALGSVTSGCQTVEPAQAQANSSASTPAGLGVNAIDGGLRAIYQDSKGHYWFGGNEKGLYRFDGKTLSLFTKADGLCSHDIVGIQEDSDKNLYFDTFHGVSRFDGESFSTLPISDTPAVQNTWVLEPGDLWFRMGWDHPGPFRYDGTQLHALMLPPSPTEPAFRAQNPKVPYSPYGIYTIYLDRRGHLWVGTSSLGVARFDGTSHAWLYETPLTETPGGGVFGFRTILEDAEGTFWINTPRFGYQIEPPPTTGSAPQQLSFQRQDPWTGEKMRTQSGKIYFCGAVFDAHGDLWMVTFFHGVWRKRGSELEHFPVQVGNRNVDLYSIYQDRDGALWLATLKEGAFRFNGTAFVPFQF